MNELEIKVIASQTANRVIIKQSEGDSHAGIFEVAESNREAPCEGIVVAVSKLWISPSGATVYPSVNVGDVVLFDKFGGTPIEISEVELLSMDEPKIICVINNK